MFHCFSFREGGGIEVNGYWFPLKKGHSVSHGPFHRGCLGLVTKGWLVSPIRVTPSICHTCQLKCNALKLHRRCQQNILYIDKWAAPDWRYERGTWDRWGQKRSYLTWRTTVCCWCFLGLADVQSWLSCVVLGGYAPLEILVVSLLMWAIAPHFSQTLMWPLKTVLCWPLCLRVHSASFCWDGPLGWGPFKMTCMALTLSEAKTRSISLLVKA